MQAVQRRFFAVCNFYVKACPTVYGTRKICSSAVKMASTWFLVRIIFLLLSSRASQQSYQTANLMEIRFKWKTIDFDWPNERAKNEAIERGEYVPNNVVIIDADYYANRYFVTSPRFLNGTPATLSEVVRIRGQYVLKPFPAWPDTSSKESLCKGAPVSVFRIHIDKCGLMWVVDDGQGNLFNSYEFTCPPKLLIYDLKNKNREILRYVFPSSQIADRSILINVITESYKSDCSDAFAYIVDTGMHGLIVFDYAKKRSWRIENKLFYPYPTHITVTSNGVTFDEADGLFGIALGPLSARTRDLYFHSFASVRESSVPLGVLKNETLASDPVVGRTAFVNSPGKRAGQSTAEVMTEDGILIYPVIPTNEIVCWNYRQPYTINNQHVIKRDNENFQFISGMKLKNNVLIITSSRFQNYVVGNVSGTDYKYRVIEIKDVNAMLKGTPCATDFHYYGTRGRLSARGRSSCV